MTANGRFKTKELMFKVSGNEFIVDCGETGQLPQGVLCTQQTVKTLVLALTEKNLEVLMKALDEASRQLESEGKGREKI